MAVRLPNRYVYSDQLVVIATASFAVFAWLNSRLHAEWARLHSSTLGDGLRYTPSDVFETIPPHSAASRRSRRMPSWQPRAWRWSRRAMLS